MRTQGLNHLLFFNCGEPFLKDVMGKVQEKASAGLKISLLAKEATSVSAPGIDVIPIEKLYREESVPQAFPGIEPVALDSNILSDFLECKEYCLRTIDRVHILQRSVREHSAYYHALLSWWLGYFETHTEIDGLFFDAAPHFPWDLVPFFVAKHKGIQTRILRRTLIESSVILERDFRADGEDSIHFPGEETFLSQVQIGDMLKESFWIQSSKSVNRKSRQSRFSCRGLAFLASFPWLIKFYFQHRQNYKISYMGLNGVQCLRLMVRQKLRVLSLQQWLNAQCREPDFDTPSIYFALHFQPERSTDPEAGDYTFQYLAIRLLAQNLPAGWKILVKEHPRQVNSHGDIKYTHYRAVEDYVRIAAIPGVSFVHPTYDSDTLIDACRLTATCTGSTVWEGMLRGKPGVNFGRCWHARCESSPLIRSTEDCRRALETLQGKSKEQVHVDIENFIEGFRPALISSVNYQGAAQASPEPRERLVSNLAGAIMRSFYVA